LQHVLDGPRARGAFALKVLMKPGWSIQVQDRAPLTVIAMISASGWLIADGQQYRLEPGDVALVRGPGPYRMSDDPTREPDVVIHPHQECTTPSGEKISLNLSQGVRSWGTGTIGDAMMLIGTYDTDAEVTAAVTSTLPRIAVVPVGNVDASILGVLGREIASNAPGQGSVIDRLLDVVLVHAVRAWSHLNPRSLRGWIAGTTDPLTARALELFHSTPAEPWTLETVAGRLHVSRATLATRFRANVGEPPMTYLTNWRLLLASELLADAELTTAHIAAKVGYGSPYALSTAFKRRYGASPTAYRRSKFTLHTTATA